MRSIVLTLSTVALLFFFALTISSCQQEPGVDFTPPPVNDSAYLSMVVNIDTTYPAGADTSTMDIITYDAQKRVSRIDFYDYFLGTPGSGTLSNVFSFYYNGNDTLPYKVSEDWFGRSSFLFYENGIVVRDSMVFTDPGFLTFDKQIVTYTKLGGNRHRTVNNYTLNGVLVDTDTMYSVVTRNSFGEILNEKDTVYKSAGMTVLEFDLTYNTNPNPFLRLMVPYPVWGVDWSSPYAEWSLHNVASEYSFSRDESGAEQEIEYEMHYQYRADGYPILKREYDDFGDMEKTYFYYKRL